MSLDLTFKQVCAFIEKDQPKLVDTVDKLLGLTFVCAPAVFGPAGLVFLPLLGVKNQLIELGKSVFDLFSRKKDADYLARQKRMEVAYVLICYTAFFDALDVQLPENLRRQIALTHSEKLGLSEDASGREESAIGGGLNEHLSGPASSPDMSPSISFPHPTESLSEQAERHLRLYQQLASGFLEFVKGLKVWDDLRHEEKAELTGKVSETPAMAIKCFEAQYLELARRFEDFAIWANLHEHKKTRELIHSLSDYVRLHARISSASPGSIDIGFAKLHEAVLSMPVSLKLARASEIVSGLTKHYDARIADPIIETKEEPNEGKPCLSFPRVCDAFIPQSFLVVRQTTKTRRLEDEETWGNLARRNDLGAFLLSYLSSPYSTQTPLLILGHPGSGKSLLTKVLAAQLMSKHYTPIRVPLREVDSEAGIPSQIEEQVGRITSVRFEAWYKLSAAFKNNPPLVILDGYDELLQASGKVFSGYLKEVQDFQRNEAEQGRPVRVIVTSRVTLIDKATIPPGSTIIKLLEFDEHQRERWVSIWNSTNRLYFEQAAIHPFQLPKRDLDSSSVLSLAEQPLLLLMLALYDSEQNQLRDSRSLDRTVLYESLLRRFVIRERGKGRDFEVSSAMEQNKEIDFDMQRLGVAAIGMYNRRKLHILSTELNEDLKFFDLERIISVTTGRALSQADLLLGSFFFVHKSRALHKAGAAEHHEETSAFEFLHNTFGEFLTADFVIRQALAEVESLEALKGNEVLRAELDQKLGSADGFSRAWFASLVYTPLYTRPVVLEMIREWVNHMIKRRNISKVKFLSHLDEIVLNQIKRVLSKREMPSIMQKETAQEGYRAPFGVHPLLGHIAIYTINLILLRTIMSDQPFVFDESSVGSHEDGSRPWDQLIHIWRSWFSLDNLNGVTAVLRADRTKGLITISGRDAFRVSESSDRLEGFLNISVALGDNISSGLAGLLLYDAAGSNRLNLDEISDRLSNEHMDLGWRVAFQRLLHVEDDPVGRSLEDVGIVVRNALHLGFRSADAHELEHIINTARKVLTRSILSSNEFRMFEPPHRFDRVGDILRLVDPGNLVNLAERSPEAALAWVQFLQELAGKQWLGRYGGEFMERALHPRQILDLIERNPRAAVTWIRLIREIGGYRWLERYGEEIIERGLNPDRLHDMINRSPEAIIGWVELVRELGVGWWLSPRRTGLFDAVFSLEWMMRVSRLDAKVALDCLNLARELRGDDWLRVNAKEFVEQALAPERLLEVAQRDPDAALGGIRSAREMGLDIRLGGEIDGVWEEMVHPGYLLGLVESNPEAALKVVRVLRELGGQRWIDHYGKEILARAWHPRHFAEVAEWNPEAAFGWFELAFEMPDESRVVHLGNEFLQHIFERRFLVQLLRNKPSAFVRAARIARALGSDQGRHALVQSLNSFLGEPHAGASLRIRLPLEALPDIHWIAQSDESGKLEARVHAMLEG